VMKVEFVHILPGARVGRLATPLCYERFVTPPR